MLAYLSLELKKEHNQQTQSVAGFDLCQPEMSYGLVEKIAAQHQRKRKTHRNIADQDVSIIEKVLERMKSVAA